MRDGAPGSPEGLAPLIAESRGEVSGPWQHRLPWVFLLYCPILPSAVWGLSTYSSMNVIGIEDLDQILNHENFAECKITCASNAKIKCRVEVTLNHPHTKPWERATQCTRRQFYYKEFDQLRSRYTAYIVNYERVIEYGDYGLHTHLHGYIDYEVPKEFGYENFKGLIVELVECYLMSLPKRYNHPYGGKSVMECWDDYFDRICIPQCCFTLRIDGYRGVEWEQYIKKNALNFEN